ncbi:MAG TPA: histidine phosphatase family protein [Mariprofundaceae bacterium]|nr:histidine phosphatase family protein [Mariprofundaceae bacterium]
MMIVDLLRHGELEGGVKYRGQIDDPLTPAGRAAMDAVWEKVSSKVDVIVSSPLSRCAAPAREWAGGAGINCVIDDRVMEIRYGAWEGKTSEEIRDEFPGVLEQWRQDPTGMRPPEGESPEELLDRLSSWWQELVKDFEGRHVLVVAHSGSLRMLLAHVIGAPVAACRKFDMPYACWSRFAVEKGQAVLAFHQREACWPE